MPYNVASPRRQGISTPSIKCAVFLEAMAASRKTYQDGCDYSFEIFYPEESTMSLQHTGIGRSISTIGIFLLLIITVAALTGTTTPALAENGVAQDLRPTPIPRTPVPVTPCPTTPAPTTAPTTPHEPIATPTVILLPATGGEMHTPSMALALGFGSILLLGGMYFIRTRRRTGI